MGRRNGWSSNGRCLDSTATEDGAMTRCRGMTQVELLASLALASVLAIACFTVIRSIGAAHTATSRRAQWTDQATLILQRIHDDIRTAATDSTVRLSDDELAIDAVAWNAAEQRLQRARRTYVFDPSAEALLVRGDDATGARTVVLTDLAAFEIDMEDSGWRITLRSNSGELVWREIARS
jgi:Tfp pilus assembly protein PilW